MIEPQEIKKKSTKFKPMIKRNTTMTLRKEEELRIP